MCVFVLVCLWVRDRVCAHARVPGHARAYLRACQCTYVGRLCVCACVIVCLRVYMRACVGLCLCACAWVCAFHFVRAYARA